MRTKLIPLFILAVCTLNMPGAAARQDADGTAAPQPSKFKLTVPAYSEGSMIPPRYTCTDPNAASPAIQWANPPANTASFAIILHDNDAAPDKGITDVTHWILWNIPPTLTQIPAGVKADAAPNGIIQGKNLQGQNGFQPFCAPPGGTPHHYILEIYALDKTLDLDPGSLREELRTMMDGHILGRATYVGMFGR